MKRYIIVFLGLLLPLSFTACGNNSETLPKDSNIKAETNSKSKPDSISEIMTDSTVEPEADITTTTEIDSMVESNTDITMETDTEMEEDTMATNQIYIKVGENILTAVLEDNESAVALKELLTDSPLTITASNYGGFEKVCSLGTELPRNDSQMTTDAKDICLYNGNQIVIFYGSNSWAYTKLGKISDIDNSELEEILSGAETEITLSLTPLH